MGIRFSYGTSGLCQTLIMTMSILAQDFLVQEQGRYIQMMLTVRHPFHEQFLITIESGLLKEITRNIFRYCEQLIGDSKADASGELLNIIAMNFMRIIMPPAIKYELGLPVLLEKNATPVDETCINFLFNSKEQRLDFAIAIP